MLFKYKDKYTEMHGQQNVKIKTDIKNLWLQVRIILYWLWVGIKIGLQIFQRSGVGVP